ncbi:YncE family protein [Clostridium carnis]
MNSIIVCNTGSDSLSKVNISDFSAENLTLSLGEKPIGPHEIHVKKNIIYTANNYNNTISVIDGEKFKEKSSIYIGPYPNDLVSYKDNLYIACAEANTVIVYDIKEQRIGFEIAIDRWPHNIEVCNKNGLIFVSNLESDSVCVIDGVNNKVIKRLKTFEYPTKIKISKDKSMLYVCESYMGEDTGGYIEIFSLKTLESIKRIKVGNSPVDICDDGNSLFISNFSDGTISKISKKLFEEVNKIYVGGMPKGIVKYKDRIFISDYLRGKLVIFDLLKEEKKVITIGKEPNAMTLY